MAWYWVMKISTITSSSAKIGLFKRDTELGSYANLCCLEDRANPKNAWTILSLLVKQLRKAAFSKRTFSCGLGSKPACKVLASRALTSKEKA
jgi:hypothetical protein